MYTSIRIGVQLLKRSDHMRLIFFDFFHEKYVPWRYSLQFSLFSSTTLRVEIPVLQGSPIPKRAESNERFTPGPREKRL